MDCTGNPNAGVQLWSGASPGDALSLLSYWWNVFLGRSSTNAFPWEQEGRVFRRTNYLSFTAWLVTQEAAQGRLYPTGGIGVMQDDEPRGLTNPIHVGWFHKESGDDCRVITILDPSWIVVGPF